MLGRRRTMMASQIGMIDTSPIIAEYDKTLNSSGGASKTIGGCYTEFYDIHNGETKICLLLADNYDISFSSNGKMQYFNESGMVEYWSTAASKNVEREYLVKEGVKKVRMSLASNSLQDSYAYLLQTGRILFAGENTEYYGKQNIKD